MKCPYCNATIADDSAFCRTCGNKIDKAAIQEEERKAAEKKLNELNGELHSYELSRSETSSRLDTCRSSFATFKLVIISIIVIAAIVAIVCGSKLSKGRLEVGPLTGLLISIAVLLGSLIGLLSACSARSKEIEILESQLSDTEKQISEVKARIDSLKKNARQPGKGE